MNVIEALENRIKKLQEYEWDAKEAKDYTACLQLYGAIIYFKQFLGELKKMKIVKVDNFDRDHISDTLIATNVSEYYAKIISLMLNEKYSGKHSPDFYRAVENDYKLYEFAP